MGGSALSYGEDVATTWRSKCLQCADLLFFGSTPGVVELDHRLPYSIFPCSNWSLSSAGNRNFVLFLNFFLLDIFFIYILNVSPFSGVPFRNPLCPPPASLRVLPHLATLAFPNNGVSNTLRPKGLSSYLMSNKANLCHICGLHPGSLHVYSLVGGPVLRHSGGLLTLLLPAWGANPLSSFSPF